jgi:hypothetical protein
VRRVVWRRRGEIGPVGAGGPAPGMPRAATMPGAMRPPRSAACSAGMLGRAARSCTEAEAAEGVTGAALPSDIAARPGTEGGQVRRVVWRTGRNDAGRDATTALGGLFGGYAWQSGPFVYGLEADVDASNSRPYTNGPLCQAYPPNRPPSAVVASRPASLRPVASRVQVLIAQQGYLSALVTSAGARATQYADTAALFVALGGRSAKHTRRTGRRARWSHRARHRCGPWHPRCGIPPSVPGRAAISDGRAAPVTPSAASASVPA